MNSHLFKFPSKLKMKPNIDCNKSRFIFISGRFPRNGLKWLLFEPPHDKTNKMTVRPAKTQISLGIRPILSESSLCAQWVAKGSSFLHADSEDSDQAWRMPMLIWVFAGRTSTLLGLSWGGSFFIIWSFGTVGLTILFGSSLFAQPGARRRVEMSHLPLSHMDRLT